jgi:hypothetical protein
MRQHNELESKFHEHQEASQRDLDKFSEENRELTGRCSQLSTKLAQAEKERDSLTSSLEAARTEAASVLEAAREGVGREKDELHSQLAAEKEEKGKLQLELNLALEMQDRCVYIHVCVYVCMYMYLYIKSANMCTSSAVLFTDTICIIFCILI